MKDKRTQAMPRIQSTAYSDGTVIQHTAYSPSPYISPFTDNELKKSTSQIEKINIAFKRLTAAINQTQILPWWANSQMYKSVTSSSGRRIVVLR